MVEKFCNECGLTKSINEFYFVKQENRYNARCKSCINKYSKKIYNINKKSSKTQVEYKTCRTCNKIKPISEFCKETKQPDGYNNQCKVCYREWQKNNRDKKKPIPTLKPEHKICNKCKQELPFSSFTKEPAGRFGLHSWCKQCSYENYKDWKINKGGKEWENNYQKRKKEIDPIHHLKFILRLRLNDALRRYTSGGKVYKTHSAIKLLGCDMEFYKQYLESKFDDKMLWENYGKYWEIDHIIPCDSFDLTIEEEQLKCFHYSNTQPLSKSENRSKGSKIIDKKYGLGPL